MSDHLGKKEQKVYLARTQGLLWLDQSKGSIQRPIHVLWPSSRVQKKRVDRLHWSVVSSSGPPRRWKVHAKRKFSPDHGTWWLVPFFVPRASFVEEESRWEILRLGWDVVHVLHMGWLEKWLRMSRGPVCNWNWNWNWNSKDQQPAQRVECTWGLQQADRARLRVAR